MKKLVLVPEARFRALSDSEVTKNSSAIMQAINQPEQREMVRSYNVAQSLLRDNTNKPDDERMREYNEKMQDFYMYKDKIKGAHMAASRRPAEKSEDDRAVREAVSAMPVSLQSSAQKLIDRIKDNGDVISWTPDGEVSIHGQKIVGSSITDLVGDAIRNTRAQHPNRAPFLEALAEMNTPDAMIKNKSALAQFQRIKDQPRETWPRIRPKGIPEHQLKDEAVGDNDFKDSSPYKPRKQASAPKQRNEIEWVNTK